MTNLRRFTRQRNKGAERPAQADSDSLDRLRFALRDRDPLTASVAARELGKDGSPEAIAVLIGVLDRSALVGKTAVQALINIGRPATGRLVAALHSQNETVRWHAAKALAGIASPASVPALIAALQDEDGAVRWEAVYGLAAIGLPALAPLLRTLATEPLSGWLAISAARVLRRLVPLTPGVRLGRLIWMLEHTQARVSVPLEAYRLLTDLASEPARTALATMGTGRPQSSNAGQPAYVREHGPLELPIRVTRLSDQIDALKQEAAWQHGERTGKTLAKESDLSMVLTLMRPASRLPEHEMASAATLQCLSGRMKLLALGREIELGEGEIVTLDHDVPHALEAMTESAFLLTIAR
jgi:quercetin dioxygenase-like cupin family protein